MINSMIYSNHIERVQKYLECRGVKVIIDPKLADDLVGQCDYRKKLIRINEPRAKEALMTIIHEGGHWMSYLKYKNLVDGDKLPKKVKEHFAYLFGLEMIVDLSVPISLKEWKRFNKPDILLPTRTP